MMVERTFRRALAHGSACYEAPVPAFLDITPGPSSFVASEVVASTPPLQAAKVAEAPGLAALCEAEASPPANSPACAPASSSLITLARRETRSHPFARLTPQRSAQIDCQPEFDELGRVIALDRQPALFMPALLLSTNSKDLESSREQRAIKRELIDVPATVVIEAMQSANPKQRNGTLLWVAAEGLCKKYRIGGGRTKRAVEVAEDTMTCRENTKSVLKVNTTKLSVGALASPPQQGVGFEPRDARSERLRRVRDDAERHRSAADTKDSHPAAVEVRWIYSERGERQCIAKALTITELDERLSRLATKGHQQPLLLQRWTRPRSIDHHLRVTWIYGEELDVVRTLAPALNTNYPAHNQGERVEVPWLLRALGRAVGALIEHIKHIGGRKPLLLRLVFKLGQCSTLAFLWCEDCVFEHKSAHPKRRMHIDDDEQRRVTNYTSLQLFSKATSPATIGVEMPTKPRINVRAKPPRCAPVYRRKCQNVTSYANFVPPSMRFKPAFSFAQLFDTAKRTYSRPISPARNDIDAPVRPQYLRSSIAACLKDYQRPTILRGRVVQSPLPSADHALQSCIRPPSYPPPSTWAPKRPISCISKRSVSGDCHSETHRFH